MLSINDKVKLTKQAKEETYENAWWTEKELIITDVHKSETVTEDDETMYSFNTVDGEEVPNSLYEYELEVVEKSISKEIEERLEALYDLVDYNLDGNTVEREEKNFLESICEDFYRGNDLNTSIEDNMYPFFEYSLKDKLEFAEYIESSIDEFIRSCGTSSFRQCLDGGIREYLFSQFFSNSLTIYTNVIYLKMNDEIRDIKEYNDKLLSKTNTIFLNFDNLRVEDFVEEFVNSFGYEHTIYDKTADTLYEEFCIFLSDKLED